MSPLLVFLILASGVTLSQPFEAEVAHLRGGHGLVVPKWDPDLALVVLERARELATEGQLSHQDAQGRGPGMQAVALGLPRGEYGEVLGVGASPEAVWRAWLASDPHREVLLEPGWQTWASASVTLEATSVWVVRFWKP